MNALRTAIRRTTPMAARRFASAPAMPKAPLPDVYQYSFKKAFFDDPACYPIIVITAFICTFVVGGTVNQALHLKDLRLFPKSKHELLQTWGEEHYNSVTSHLAAGPMVMHGDDHRSTWREGLGVDHEEWLKQKAARDAEPYHN